MDKRKNKIHSLLKQIKDEREAIKFSLDTIVQEIERKVNCEHKKTDMLETLDFEFQVLKKFTEINFTLESFMEDETLCDKKEPLPLSSPVTKPLFPSKTEALEVFSTSLQNGSLDTASGISFDHSLPSTSTGINNEYSFKEDVDISVLKDNVKKLTEKLGLNDQLNQYQQIYGKGNNNVEQLLPERDVTPSCSLNNTLEEKKTETSAPVVVHPVNEEETSTEYESISSSHTESTAIRSDEKNPPTLLEKLAHLNNSNNEPGISSSINIPNHVKVKPTSFGIKNNLKKTKKGKNKKNSEKIMHELKEKDCPEVGSECAFSHIESPDEFYVHLLDNHIHVLDELSHEIKEYAKTLDSYKTKDEASEAVGRYGVVLSSDGEWYRVEIIDWNLDNRSNQITAKLCDYGSNILVDFKNVRRLNEELTIIPKLAVRCHLPYLFSPDSTHTNRLKNWSSSTIEAMIDMSGLFNQDLDEHKLFKIVYAHRVNNSIEIDLYNTYHSEPNQTVGQILLDVGMAVQLINELNQDDLALEEYLEDAETFGTAENVNEAVQGYDPQDQARICQFTRPNGTCFKGKHCKYEHVVTKGGFTTDKIPCYMQAFNDLILPKKGDQVQILITGFINLCNFYAQIIRNPVKERKYVMDASLQHLIKTMNSPNVIKTYEKFKVYPAIGEFCIVYYWTGQWLRGAVRGLNYDKNMCAVSAEVWTLDFGDRTTILLENIRHIREEFLLLPLQVIQCYLSNYQELPELNPAVERRFFEQNILCKNFFAVVKNTMLPLKVEIIDHKYVDIGTIMFEKKLVKKREEDFYACENSRIQCE